MNNKKFDRIVIDAYLEKIKKNKVNPENIILNACAIQDQMLLDMGLKKRKKRKINIIKEEKDLFHIKNQDTEIIERRKNFIENLTFAEKVGIKTINKLPLSVKEWKKIENDTIKREEYKHNCSICLEALSKRQSVILSCSHVFHKFCILNFEKFSGNKKCPVCRCQNYESKEYYKDKEYFLNKSVILIQKFLRGYLCRLKLFKSHFTFNMPNNKHLRSIYSPWKIKELTNKMINVIQQKNKNTNELIQFINKDINELKIRDDFQIKEIKYKGWEDVMKNIHKRKMDNCAICLASMNGKKIYITSCSHCFHKNCLDSFEKYDHYYEKRCPICRSSYDKIEKRFDE